MSQNRYAIPAWSYLFEKVKPSSIIEIGTSEGGMSCLLALAARQLGATFDTFDVGDTVNKKMAATLAILCGPHNGFHRGDVFDDEAQSIISHRFGTPGACVALCDGGMKPKEFALFSTMTKKGDIIGVHDARGRESWPWQEFHEEHAECVMREQCLEEFMPEVFLETGWFVARKKSVIS